ncbi:hypothetical protein [Alkalicoccus saliphilus]|uniref:Antigen I/II N-terminal domain-containing protein n=1 Tax=Alkalicoccus saliphilus TaxID=200989 RepID=A0A2T4U2K1_9BACI|nr:hypothetical protein [Alkalicoccus saliphilus]PTL37631.1 hypothetical protein C6Y45_15555 [Alkalicoccus saliphilus]
MRKYIFTSVAAAGLLAATACGGSEENTENNQIENNGTGSNNEGEIGNDENEPAPADEDKASESEERTVTFPADFMEETDMEPEELEASAEEDDTILDVEVHDDGSATYTMTEQGHSEMLEQMAAEIRTSMEEIEDGEDFPSISEVQSSDDFSEFTFLVDRETFEDSFDGFAAFTVAYSGMFYQLFDGVESDDYEVVVNVEDEESGEVIDTSTFPDDMDEMEE